MSSKTVKNMSLVGNDGNNTIAYKAKLIEIYIVYIRCCYYML